MRSALHSLAPEDYGIYKESAEFFLESMEGDERVRELGGLHVIGSERHEARRIDNQLRGRAPVRVTPALHAFISPSKMISCASLAVSRQKLFLPACASMKTFQWKSALLAVW